MCYICVAHVPHTDEHSPYNEFIIDGVAWNTQLPHSIDAFLSGQPGSIGAHEASQAHAAFLKAYGLSHDDVPLVEPTGNAYAPFRRAVVVA